MGQTQTVGVHPEEGCKKDPGRAGSSVRRAEGVSVSVKAHRGMRLVRSAGAYVGEAEEGAQKASGDAGAPAGCWARLSPT